MSHGVPHQFKQFLAHGIRESVVRQALTESSEIDQSGQLAPVLRQLTARLLVAVGKMRLSERARRTFVAQEVADIGERSTGNGELPVKNRSYRSTRAAAYQKIPFAEIAVNESCLVVQWGKV